MCNRLSVRRPILTTGDVNTFRHQDGGLSISGLNRFSRTLLTFPVVPVLPTEVHGGLCESVGNLLPESKRTRPRPVPHWWKGRREVVRNRRYPRSETVPLVRRDEGPLGKGQTTVPTNRPSSGSPPFVLRESPSGSLRTPPETKSRPGVELKSGMSGTPDSVPLTWRPRSNR